MNTDWESQISKIIQESTRELEELNVSKEIRMKKKSQQAKDIKDILSPKLLYVLEKFKENIPEGPSVYTQDQAYIADSEFDIELRMPNMSDVNKMDLLFRIEFDDKLCAVLRVYNKYSPDKIELVGSADKDLSPFIEASITQFILSWYKRKLGDEIAKEKMLELKVRSKEI